MTAVKAEQAVSIKEEKATMSLRKSFDHQCVLRKDTILPILYWSSIFMLYKLSFSNKSLDFKKKIFQNLKTK